MQPDLQREEVLAYRHGDLDTVFVSSVDAGRVPPIHAVRNPEKLAWLQRQLAGQD